MSNEKPKEYLGIREIAKLAHVSPSTVSRVINSPERTSEEVRNQVNAVIKKYHYIPNQLAKNLFSKSSNAIAVFIHDMTNAYFMLLLKELSRLAFEQKYTLLTCNINNSQVEQEYLDYCQSIRTKGIIVVDGPFTDLYKHTPPSIKLVSFDRVMDSWNHSSVTANQLQGIDLVLEHLVGLGHRKIAYAADKWKSYGANTRKHAYQQLIGWKYNLPYREDYVGYFECAIPCGLDIVNYYMSLPDPPTAILCTNDTMAIGVLMGAQHLGLKVPEDLSIVGFDGLNENFSFPKLTTVKQDYHQIARHLFDNIVDPVKAAQVHHDVVDVSLSIGQTTGPAKR
ncbi:LacI family DNA-binding transcriptional regulator [Zongyangia hominis]|uniref:LacI family DNA-binding transcriptional regulator n=1 Tax=Zongyangia hominis TaxID=2763677 RepID=A0A926ECD6_9FIRM|nr:LacI family DNA-binding transcriptional regulator [Zongyangia hominis]MBC8569366.1 LacI family DNA-binding transcriptional regulator [Zongyangia hominis]